VEFTQASADNKAGAARRLVPWLAGALAVLVASSALPQGNIDAGKSPAQMFADTCSNCHRRPSELKRGASASFLRQHYTPGAQEAAAMANYLASVPADPRGKERGKASADKEKAKVQQAQERPPQDRGQERSKAQPSKSKRPEIAKSEPPEPPAETRVEAASVPKLEPFEE
jgi:mono/diheme cytochrome c family protein